MLIFIGERQAEWILLDRYRRQFFLKHEFKKLILKNFLKNSYIPLNYKYLARVKLSLIPTLASVNKHRNRCIITGRKHNVLQKVQYSRFVFRAKSYKGSMPGVSRLSR